jgi:mono/diheme cytochrome c family protein
MAARFTPIRVVAGLVVLAVLCVLVAWLAAVIFGNAGGDRTETLAPGPDRALIDRGAYLAVMGDCAACHTAPGGKSFAGGLSIPTPIGAVYTTNITPDKETGIGRYSLGDFERAVRRGIRPDGSSLYPAMPFPSYAHTSDSDIQALYAYFMDSVAPVAQVDRKADIPWPLSMRWPLTYWRWAFGPAVAQAPRSASDPLLARGAYLVEGLGHCGSCHTPRGYGLQEKALTAADGPAYLAGSVVDHYLAGDLRGDDLTGLGRFSEEDIIRLLQTGRNSNTAVFGGMTDVVTHSTQFMREDDLRSIAHFLKSLPGSGRQPAFVYDAAVASALASGDVSTRGGLDYLNNCAACHLSSGKGYGNTFPALAGNPVVNSADPSSLITLVLNGATIPATDKTPTGFTMPPFRDRLTDQEVTDVVTFIRSSWGNKAAPVDAAQVAKIRQATGAPVATGAR